MLRSSEQTVIVAARFEGGPTAASRCPSRRLLAGVVLLLWTLALLLVVVPARAAPERTDAAGKGEGEPEPMVLMIPPADEAPPSESQDAGTIDIMKEKRRLFDRGAESRARVAADYRDVLLILGASGRDAALSALLEFESDFMEGREPEDVEDLLDAEVEVVRWLAVRDLEAVVPLLALHHDAYRLFSDRGEPILAGHASRLAASIADLYAREGDSEGSRVLGARALATLGIYSVQQGVKLQGLGLLLAALRFDPDSEAALLGLASIHERGGNYHRAAEYLQQLLETFPDHREGRLRMAVNLVRLGSDADARQLLERLVSEGETDWVTAVAFQELAGLHRDAERFGEAEEVLWQGLERLPGDGGLRTQLALVLDLRHLPQRSLAVIQELPRTSVQTVSPSPRRRYGIGPQEAYEAARAALEESASSRAGRLARLLESGSAQTSAGGAP